MRGADAGRGLPLALLAAGTTWFTMLSWRGFADLWGAYLGPLLLVALVVAVDGVLLRAVPLPRRPAVGLHVLLVALVVWLLLGGSLTQPVSSTREVADTIHDAWISSSTFAPPIPETVPSIAPLAILSGALALLLVDLLACWTRRVTVAGLPLAAVYLVTIGLPGDRVSWGIFLGSAAGFLLMLFVEQSAHLARWGRPLGGSAAADPHGFGVSTGASRANATAVGAAALVLAVILPLFIPTLHLDAPRMFGPGAGGGVKVDNPVTDMRRNLVRGNNVRLLEVRTTDPDPSYLRIAVLTTFDGVEWTTGDRPDVPDQTADGLLPFPEQYLGRGVPTTAYPYVVTVTKYFDSKWLPTEFPVSSVSAPGAWQYDLGTMDFRSVSSETNTRGITYRMTAAKPQLSAYSMVHSLPAPHQIQSTYTALPSQASPLAEKLAERVTKDATSRYEKMLKLQNWFRSRFTYSLNRAEISAADDKAALDRFLARGRGGRVGYCEQFASAFAVMARWLDIPARVAVGFLQPSRLRNGDWSYRAYDMHAWPEVFFRGSGWVRFEPTPGPRVTKPPHYTTGEIQKHRRGTGNVNTHQIGQATKPTPTTDANMPTTRTSTASTTNRIPWMGTLVILVLMSLFGVLVTAPGTVRRWRRTRRLAGGAEDAWRELRDSAVDLGVAWPHGRSPHETGAQLAAWFGPDPEGPSPARPRRGRGLAPAAESALNRLVLMVEQVRYARDADDVPGALADDVRVCVEALEHGSTHRALHRARWLPRSVVSRSSGSGSPQQPERRAVTLGGAVDHAD